MDIPPIALSIGDLAFRWSTVYAALGVALGVAVALRWAPSMGDSPLFLAILVVGAGLVAGRGAVLLERPEILRRGPAMAMALAQGGISVPAAALGGALALALGCLVLRAPFAEAFDAAGVALLAGSGVALLGVLINGDLGSSPFESPLAITYSHPESALPPSLLNRPVQPLALYMLGIEMCGLLAASVLRPRMRPGDAWWLCALALGLAHALAGLARVEAPWALEMRQDQLLGALLAAAAATALIMRGLATPARAAA